MNVEDDSENDSDYSPEKDDENEEIDNINDQQSSVADVSFSRKRKANLLWDEIQKEEESFRSAVKNKIKPIREENKSLGAKKSNANSKLLSQIFGKSVAKSMTTKSCQSHTKSGLQGDVKSLASDLVKRIQKKTKIVEVRKFAGENISVIKTVSSSSHKDSCGGAKESSSGGLDGVLAVLKGPKVVSTISKSSNDWENYKEQEGLEDDLATAVKNGYLTRKDFLDRCDVRKFEKERDARAANSQQVL